MSLPVVLASYFNHKDDPQRKTVWEPDHTKLLPLIHSVIEHGIDIKIFHNCFDNLPILDRCEWIEVEADQRYTPNILRYVKYLEYLPNHPEYTKIFFVDSTDVEMLKNPFDQLKQGVLYVGDERMKVGNDWMQRTQGQYLKIPDYKTIIDKYKGEPLLNCGIIGGDRETVLRFLGQLTQTHEQYSRNLSSSSDMSVFNYTILKHFKDIIEHGPHVNTRFKQYERNDISWWKHK
jgi:hypothetical protein